MFLSCSYLEPISSINYLSVASDSLGKNSKTSGYIPLVSSITCMLGMSVVVTSIVFILVSALLIEEINDIDKANR